MPGNHRHPEHRAEIVRPQQHQPDRQQRPEEGADRVQRLAQPERRAAYLRRRDVGEQRIARRAAYTLADAVAQARGEDHAHALCQREHRLGDRAQAVAEQRQDFALAEIIAQRAGEHLHDQRGRFGQPLDHADRQHADAQRRHHEHRQQAVDHLGRDIHQQADKAEHPDTARDFQIIVSHVFIRMKIAASPWQYKVVQKLIQKSASGCQAGKAGAEEPVCTWRP